MITRDSQLGIDVLVECEQGAYRALRQLVFVERSGKTHHLPIRDGMTPDNLLEAYAKLGVAEPVDTQMLCEPDDESWTEALIKKAWPSVTFGEGSLNSPTCHGLLGTFDLTSRYFRAVAKIGFHYFLTQFPEYAGHEKIFADLRGFILDDSVGVDIANNFVGRREYPLLGGMLTPGARPDAWRAHVLCAETRPGKCLAYVQMFISEVWPAPTYSVRLAGDPRITHRRAVGHAYVYSDEGPKGSFVGDALELHATFTDLPLSAFEPVVKTD